MLTEHAHRHAEVTNTVCKTSPPPFGVHPDRRVFSRGPLPLRLGIPRRTWAEQLPRCCAKSAGVESLGCNVPHPGSGDSSPVTTAITHSPTFTLRPVSPTLQQREEAHLLMSVVHKAHVNDNHTTHHDSSRALPPRETCHLPPATHHHHHCAESTRAVLLYGTSLRTHAHDVEQSPSSVALGSACTPSSDRKPIGCHPMHALPHSTQHGAEGTVCPRFHEHAKHAGHAEFAVVNVRPGAPNRPPSTLHPPTPLCTCISSTERLLTTTCTSHLFCCCEQAQQYYDLLPRDSPPVSPPSSDPALKKKVDNKKGNRLAAKRCREKKKQYIAFLEERCGYLEASVRYNCSLPRPHTAYRLPRSLAHRTLPTVKGQSATNCSQSPALARRCDCRSDHWHSSCKKSSHFCRTNVNVAQS